MKIALHIPKKRNTISSNQFEQGRLYRCIKPYLECPTWENCIAWKAASSNPDLGINRGEICAIRLTEGGYKLEKFLHFSESYEFDVLPEGSTIKFETTKVKTVETTHTFP